jgi:hypothetical protein
MFVSRGDMPKLDEVIRAIRSINDTPEMRIAEDEALAAAAERLKRQKSGVKRPSRSVRRRRNKERREVQLAEEEEDSEQKGVRCVTA